MGPIQNHDVEKLLPSDRAIVMARRMLFEATEGLQQGREPTATLARPQAVRAAGVLLPHDQKPQEWARKHPVYGEDQPVRSEEHTSELQSLMRSSYAILCLKKK